LIFFKKYKLSFVLIIIAALVAGVTFFVFMNNTKEEKPISYNKDIRPILSDKCFSCHGPDVTKMKAGLRLDKPENALAELSKNKGHYAIVPGSPEKSELIRRIESTDPNVIMPQPESHLAKLTPSEIEMFKRWIREGAKYEKHWAFVAPIKTSLPKIENDDWVKNEIDYFIAEKIEEKNLSPNPIAEKENLIKRTYIDLIGLPPTYTELQHWNNNNTTNWYDQLIGQLMSKPAYGEKMSLLWLDLARYADSYGYQDDNIRTQWPWRDWVIKALNKNMHYDEFLMQQIAGDLMPNANKENILATAFWRNHKYTEEGGVIEEEYRVTNNIDKTRTYGKAILGVTIECAQCHDHKYDPFTAKDYYQLYAFFNISKEKGYEGDVSISTPAKTPKLYITAEDRKNIFAYLNTKDTGKMEVSVMGDTNRPTYLLSRGRYDAPAELVKPAAIESIMPFDTTKYERNRLGLAKWTVNKKNPLTARVFVNFIWQDIFGKGLVKTSGDFGLQGELPTHAELLDWLAVDFMEHNWDIKYLVKKIMSSATYMQSAIISKQHLEKDPENNYYARSSRIRLKAEFIRDWILSTSGLLNTTIGGPSVKPYQPKGVWESTTSGRGQLAAYKQDHGEALYRRGMYTFIKLTAPPPSMMLFDASNRDQCEAKRSTTNTPLQALNMLNDPTVLEASRVLAQKLSVENLTVDEKIKKAFELILIRKPKSSEANKLIKYFENQEAYYKANKLLVKKTITTGEFNNQLKIKNEPEVAALMKICLLLYNLDETITKS
jgi:phage gpG-like protein